MPDLIITRNVIVGGVLTDADTVPVLRDPTSTYGLRRDDTLATVINSGTPMVRQSTGVYALTVLALTAGISYTYWIETTVGGSTTRQEKHYTADADEQAVVSRYASVAGVRAILGNNNLNTYSNLDDETVAANFDTIQHDITAADDHTDLRAERGTYFSYVTPIATTVPRFASIQYATNLWAAALLMEHRVISPRGTSSDQVAQDIVYVRGLADNEYKLLFDADRALIGTPVNDITGQEIGSFVSVPLNVNTCCRTPYWLP